MTLSVRDPNGPNLWASLQSRFVLRQRTSDTGTHGWHRWLHYGSSVEDALQKLQYTVYIKHSTRARKKTHQSSPR